ncbi:MAG: hypothetical protein AAB074_10220 [Planctomycetota bacterium]
MGLRILIAASIAALLPGCGDSGPQGYASAPAYAVATDSRASVTPVITCGEPILLDGGVYVFPGVPDGMGWVARDGKLQLFVNHEWPKAVGTSAGPLASGARISELTLEGGKVVAGRPAIDEVWMGEPASKARAGSVAIAKLCSAYLAGAREGFDPPMFLTGEETSGKDASDPLGGQAFGLAEGALYALPKLGRAPWENLVVVPGTGATTAVVGFEDAPAAGDGLHAELYLYVGTKDKTGIDPPARNGLRGGKLFTFVPRDAAQGSEAAVKDKGKPVPGRWVEMDASKSDAALDAAAVAAGAFRFVRIEDGAPDPSHPGTLYFTTTGRPLTCNPLGRVWKLEIDPKDPAAGGTITIVLDGSEGIVSPDNIDVNAHGELAICEDPVPGLESLGLKRDSSLWIYEIPTAKLTRVLEVSRAAANGHWVKADPALNSIDKGEDKPGGWEFSGVVDAEGAFGRGAWLINVQAHGLKTRNPAIVQGGQILRFGWKP